MKATNYEISKQLAEAGFAASTEFYWVKWNAGEPELVHEKEQTPALIEKVGAWDLETILEALPRRIELRKMGKDGVIYELHACFQRSYSEGFKESNYIGYQNFQGFHQELCFMQKEDESLADTAARLWLKLKKEGLL